MSNNLKIKGTETVSGGQFDNVKISGNGKINGDVKCDEFECAGKINVVGDLEAREIEIDGNCVVLGKVTSGELELKGVAKFDGDSKIKEIDVDGRIVFCDELESEDVTVDGECKVFGNVQSDKININGFLSVGRNCETKQFASNGKVDIVGLLTAETADVKLFWDSKVKEINAHKVVVEKVDKLWVKLVSLIIRPNLHVETIEGDDVNISFTKANVVRGKDVTIGEGCEIETVEYSENYRCCSKSKVGKVVKIK